MKTEQTEQEELIVRETIANTPFTAIRLEGKWFLSMGKYRLTPPLESLDECLAETAITWDRLIQVMAIMKELKTNEQTN